MWSRTGSVYPSAEERFGFGTRGSFLCASAYDNLVMIVLHALAVLGVICIIGDIAVPAVNTSGAMFYGITAALALFVWLFVISTIIRLAMRGVRYNYKADEKCFTVYCKRETLVFEYSQVMSVTYTPIYYLRRQRGYRVVVKTTAFSKEFVYLFENMRLSCPTEKTPFFIIEERAGLVGQEIISRI